MRYEVKRILQSVFTVFLVATLTFVLIRLLPGDPLDRLRRKLVMGSSGLTAAQISALADVYLNMRPDAPIWLQYVHYLESLFLHADLGRSIWLQRPVAEIIANALPWTVFYMSIALILSFGLNVLIGSVIAYYEGSRLDAGVTTFFMTFSSVPYYVFAILMIWFLAYGWGLFPTNGRVNGQLDAGLNVAFVSSVLYHAALPIASLVVARLGAGLGMRSNAIRVLGSDYMRVGRLRGLSEARLATRYLARNAILPAYTGLMIAMGAMIGGSVILERIFGYPGIGFYLYKALNNSDYPLLMGTFLAITIAIVLGILIADLTYPLVDPRARDKENREQYGGGGGLSLSWIRRLFRDVRRRIGSGSGGDGDSSVRTQRAVADGGAPVFLQQTLSLDLDSAEESRRKRLFHVLDTYVVVPLKIVLTDWRGVVGLLITVSFVFIGTVGVYLVEPTFPFDGPQFVQPFTRWAFPLGTDNLGRDIFALLVHGTPLVLKLSLVGAAVSTGTATVIGVYAGYAGGRIETVLNTFTDAVMTLPGLPLVIVLTAIFDPQSVIVIGILLSTHRWAGLARRLRSQVLTLREESYIEASRTMGVSTPRIIADGVLPNIMPYIIVNFINSARAVIYAAIALRFLGFLPVVNHSWGVVMQYAYDGGALVNFEIAYWLLAPLATISLYAFGLVMLAQSMDKIFNPRLKARHAERTRETETGATSIGDSP